MSREPMTCVYCAGRSLWRSRSTKLGRLTRFFCLHPIRCNSCQKMFWKFTLFPPPVNPASKRVRTSPPRQVMSIRTKAERDVKENEDSPLQPAAGSAESGN